MSKKEEISIPAESLWLIAHEAGGSMRDALSLLDQIICAETDALLMRWYEVHSFLLDLPDNS